MGDWRQVEDVVDNLAGEDDNAGEVEDDVDDFAEEDDIADDVEGNAKGNFAHYI